MNTWEKIPGITRLCQYHSPVYATDGKNVYFGRFHFFQRALIFTGCGLQDGELLQVPASELTGWQPAPKEMCEPVVYAHWKSCSNDGRQSSILYKCSRCNRAVRLPFGIKLEEAFPYCHCGAKMVKEETE